MKVKRSVIRWAVRGLALLAVTILAMTTLSAANAAGNLVFVVSATSSPFSYGSDSSFFSTVSRSGRFITFESKAEDFISGSLIGKSFTHYDIFLYERDNSNANQIFDENNDDNIFLISSTGGGNYANDESRYPVVYEDPYKSGNEVYVVYTSKATDIAHDPLGDADTNGFTDVYLKRYKWVSFNNHPLASWRVSLSDSEAEPNADSGYVRNSATYPHPGAAVYVIQNGRADNNDPYAIFQSKANNLLAPPRDGHPEDPVNPSTTDHFLLYTRDIVHGTTKLAVPSYDPGSNGGLPDGDCTHPVVSPDGRWLAFVSKASNLINGVTPPAGKSQIYLMDRDPTGDGTFNPTDYVMYLVSKIPAGAIGNDSSVYPSIAINDNKVMVAFQSDATNLSTSPVDNNNRTDVYYYHMDYVGTGAALELASRSESAIGNRNSTVPNLSPDGLFTAFSSYANNLISDDTNDYCESDFDPPAHVPDWYNCSDIFIRENTTGVVWRVSMTASGEENQDFSSNPSMSLYSRYVGMTSRGDMAGLGTSMYNYQDFVVDQGEYAGNPAIDPRNWRFFYSVGDTASKTYRITYLSEQQLMNIHFEPDQPNFHITGETCNRTISESAGYNCQFQLNYDGLVTGIFNFDIVFTVEYSLPAGGFVVQDVRTKVRGNPISGFMPIIVDTTP